MLLEETEKMFNFSNNKKQKPQEDKTIKAKSSEHKNTDLTMLLDALKGDEDKKKIFQIIDRVINERSSEVKDAKHEEFKNPTPDFDYNNFQKSACLFGIPPRDFQAYIPVLRILKLENYDRNDFSQFNLIESLEILKKLWKNIYKDCM